MNLHSSQEAAPLEQSHLTFPRTPIDGNRPWQVAALLFALISFLEISRVLDTVHVHAIAVLMVLLAAALVLSRRALVFWKCGAGRALPCFVAWVVLTYLLAPHTELSTPYLLSCVEGLVFFLAGVGLLGSVSDFRTFFRMLAVAGLIVCALGIVWSGTMNGRHALRAGPYTDPNSYAMALLELAPILWIAFPEKPVWMRLGSVLAALLPLLISLRTVSRGAFVAMLVMAAVVFVFASGRIKIAMASAAVLVVIVLLAFLPESVRTRLAAAARISSVTGEHSVQNTDAVSLDSRETMLMTSINVTLAYPFVGVGPGNFGPTIAEFGRMQNQNWINLNTHNSYTQISSETGLPGLLAYLLMIGFTIRSLVVTLRRTGPRGNDPNSEIHRYCAAMVVLLAASWTCMFFLSEGYSLLNFLWFGLANGLRLLLPAEPEEEEEFVEVDPALASR